MNKCFFGDCRETMRNLIADGVKVQMCVTSPPYFGLRDYGHPGQLGLEQTPAEYVANMVEVFSLVWYLLADDGVLWLNLGDSYSRSQESNVPQTKSGTVPQYPDHCKTGSSDGSAGRADRPGSRTAYLQPKNLLGIPWRVAFALQEAGWYLRQDIIWHKLNPMPESVTDRCTKAHEYMFLLTKSERYYFDNEAIKEPASDNAVSAARRNRADFGTVGTKAIQGNGFGQSGIGVNADHKGETRNRRSVWTVATIPYSGAHFATFPPALIEPCILAGSRVGDIVLDPFFGSGTTGQVSQALGRQWIGCELNPEYSALQSARTSQQSLMLEVS
jgi:DNA modification methylase